MKGLYHGVGVITLALGSRGYYISPHTGQFVTCAVPIQLWNRTQNSELRNYFIRPYTHLQNKVQCMNNNVYIIYIWVKETPTKTK